MKHYIVSIIIPLYNKEAYIRETLDSLIDQTYEYWEAVVIDDHSTDNSAAIAQSESNKDSRIKVVRLDENRGAQHARNVGIIQASGDLIIFLDADDLLSDEALENRVGLIQSDEDLDLVVSGARSFNYNNNQEEEVFDFSSSKFDDDLTAFLANDPPWYTAQPTWRKETVHRVGDWDEKIEGFQDQEYHIRALIKGVHYKKSSEIDCYWRKNTTESISRSLSKAKYLDSHEYLFRKIVSMLDKYGKNENDYRKYLSSRFYWLANLHVRVRNKSNAYRKYWSIVRNKKLLPWHLYMIVKIHFELKKFGLLKKIYDKLFRSYVQKHINVAMY